MSQYRVQVPDISKTRQQVDRNRLNMCHRKCFRMIVTN